MHNRAIKKIPFFNKPIRASLRLLGLKSKVNLVVTGMPKAGTTALHSMLVDHNEFNLNRKEINYFNTDDWFRSPLGDAEYHCHFPLPWNKKKYTIDTSFYMYHPKFHDRILEYNPNVKIIVILRNPTARYISDYVMIRGFFRVGKPGGTELGLLDKIKFDARTLNDDKKSTIERINPSNILRTGIVDQHVSRLISHIPKKQLLFIKQEELKTKHAAVMNEIGNFLEVDLSQIKPRILNQAKSHVENENLLFSKDERIQAEEILNEFYAPFISRTESMIEKFNSTN